MSRAQLEAGEADLPQGRDYHLGRAEGLALAAEITRRYAQSTAGEAFAHLLPATGSADASERADRLLGDLENQIRHVRQLITGGG